MRTFNLIATLFWVANIPAVVAFYVKVDRQHFERRTLLYLALVSVWANAAAHLTAYLAD